jgi:WhiB family transcriptional regulator, redox-sensing transcriptional regulator
LRDISRELAAAPRWRGITGLAPADEGWEFDASCRSKDPTLFFGPNRFEPKRERLAREAEAKMVCQTCPALQACREHAVEHSELYGVWGGLGEGDRRGLIEARQGAVARSA